MICCLFRRCSEEMVWQAKSDNNRCNWKEGRLRCREQLQRLAQGKRAGSLGVVVHSFPVCTEASKDQTTTPRSARGSGQYACAESGADSSGADVGAGYRAPRVWSVAGSARGLCTLDQTPGAALSQQERKDICLQ